MRGPRVNKRIRANEVQLITHEGDNIGIVPIGEALDRGDKVKFTIRFKGREMDYMKAAYDLVDKIITDTKDISKVEQKAKLEGRQMTLIIQPN